MGKCMYTKGGHREPLTFCPLEFAGLRGSNPRVVRQWGGPWRPAEPLSDARGADATLGERSGDAAVRRATLEERPRGARRRPGGSGGAPSVESGVDVQPSGSTVFPNALSVSRR